MDTEKWEELTRAEQDLYVTLLWQDNHSEKAIADFFGTTKGRIVVHRQRVLKLPSGGRDPLRVKQAVDPEVFRDLLDLHAMRELEERGVAVIAPLVAVTPSRVCEWPLSSSTSFREMQRCGQPVVPGQRLCEEHLAVARGFPRRRL